MNKKKNDMEADCGSAQNARVYKIHIYYVYCDRKYAGFQNVWWRAMAHYVFTYKLKGASYEDTIYRNKKKKTQELYEQM